MPINVEFPDEASLTAAVNAVGHVVNKTQDDESSPEFRAERAMDAALLEYERRTPTGEPPANRASNQAPTLRIYLDLSTSVITEREMNVIEACPVRVVRHEYGAWVHVPPVEPEGHDELSLDQSSALEPEEDRELAYLETEYPGGSGDRPWGITNRIEELRDRRELGEDWSEFRNLLMVLRAARDLGADWINLDGDGHDIIPGLPTFEW